MMRVALFARYSSKMQDEMSIEAQLSEMEAHAARHGWTVTHRFLLPETRSAQIEEAPEFLEMMGAARKREFDVLLLHKLDRFGRDRETAVVHKAMLRRHGIQVRSVVENLGDGIMDRLVEAVLEGVNEWYSANLGQETRKGHKQLTRKGFWTGGKPPWGYRVEAIQEGAKGHKRLVPDPTNAPLIRDAFAMLAEGARTGDILNHIQARCGERWHLASFYTRIRNPIYKGVAEYGRTQLPAKGKRQPGSELVSGEVAALVEESTWKRANHVLNERGKGQTQRRAGREAHFYALAGVAVCDLCEAPIVGGFFNGRKRHGERRYICSRRHNGCPGKHRSVRADLIEAHVHDFLARKITMIDLDAEMDRYMQSLQPQRDDAKKRESRMRAQLTELRRKSNNLVRALEDGGGDIPEVARRLREIRAEEETLAQEIATCQVATDQSLRDNVALVWDYLQHTKSVLPDMESEEIRTLYRSLIVLRLNLPEQRGQLCFKLTPNCTDMFDVVSGRSARTRVRQTHPAVVPVWEWSWAA